MHTGSCIFNTLPAGKKHAVTVFTRRVSISKGETYAGKDGVLNRISTVELNGIYRYLASEIKLFQSGKKNQDMDFLFFKIGYSPATLNEHLKHFIHQWLFKHAQVIPWLS